ncbi:hypothetical protein [Amycolatopsis sp. CA-230715]|uniref:hypothetical protein n=1 Tax=Amycolatopsis sp. CA-230715 TaxID=2745196 RepID=UPI001C021033|nr:hypothetical protein [Amycolatopsis sp. CA-230715]QWF76998.1 hypothetical protein HUW46_00378 [Amycolatopsis sp. CA-230715]
MLYIVLLFILAALGLLVAALITATSLWAWISLGVSAVALALLGVDRIRRRARAKQAAAAEDGGDDDLEGAEDESVSGELPSEDESEGADQTALLPAAGELESAKESDAEEESAAEDGGATQVTESGDPAEEQTDAADLLVVSELETEVVVVDEFPRYHLTDCRWLADRDTIPIAVKEARDLGFTPCARCTPDSKLAAEHRKAAKASKSED